MAEVSRSDFLDQFPEFATTDTTLIDAKLFLANHELDEEVWDDQWVAGVLYLAAHLLSIAPRGQQARMQAATGETTYSKEFDRLKKTVARGWLVI